MDKKVKEGAYDHEACCNGCELGVYLGRGFHIDGLPWNKVP